MHCTCQTCNQNPAHLQRAAHEFIVSIKNLLTLTEVCSCICQIGDRERLSASALDSLREIGGVSSEEVRIAQQELDKIRSASADRFRGIGQLIVSYAADKATEDVLMQVAQGRLYETPVSLHVRINGKTYSFLIPTTTRDGFNSLYEVLGQRVYEHHAPPVDTIYDLGAFIGISAIYLGATNPDAHLVCVEPVPDNLTYLRTNLALNPWLQHRVVPLAIGQASGEILCNTLVGSSMGNSTAFTPPNSSEIAVATTTLGELAPQGRYGLKVDMEGAEFSMREDQSTIRDAQWIIGELHYGSFSKPDDRWLRALLNDNFMLHLDYVRVSKDGPAYLAAQNFQAL